MSDSPTATVRARVEPTTDEGLRSAEDLRIQEKRYAKTQQPELARAARRRRMAIDETEAERILGGSRATTIELLKLAKRLAEYKKIGLARRILRLARSQGLSKTGDRDQYQEVFRKSALYTYKDPDLPLEWRLQEALAILSEVEDLSRTENQETLGLAGAIYQRKWEVDGLRLNLQRTLFYYLRGYALGIQAEHVEAELGKGSQRSPEDVAAALAVARVDVIRYLREHPGCVLRAATDRGYCGINAAFVLDLLARDEELEAERAGLTSIASRTWREAAGLIRQEIIRSVVPLLNCPGSEWLADEWWFYATVGEAHFGLGGSDAAHYESAVEWLVTRPDRAGLRIHLAPGTPAGLEVPAWEYESTARQLARLARVQGDPAIAEENFGTTLAGKTLARVLGQDGEALRSAFRGKYGLGLSGGGFRAALFHIGMLAQLAELDVLRHVEVLSCVSGGSIVGAYYYLEVRHLLQTKHDAQISAQDYIDIVKRLESHFLAGVQRNIRTRVLAEWVTNLRMIFSSGYTRTLRAGDLFERELFSRVEDVSEEDADGKTTFRSPLTGPKWLPDWLARQLGHKRDHRILSELFIHPKRTDGKLDYTFDPSYHNWRRKCKVPILVLNATSLNTGHGWQFTASFMGEPPAPIITDIDCNYRLRRMYYRNAPKRYRKFRLGHAVAASSCVPGLFEPLILDGLYPDDDEKLKDEHLISVRLVDGGACDNQGVATLLEQDCTVMLVSDASGQMEAANAPAGDALGVLLRTNNVFQARIREAQYENIAARKRISLLRGLMFIHLRQELRGGNVAWKDCPASLRESEFENSLDRLRENTTYGVATTVQRRLSQIRTDIDSFNDAEAFALMASAYRMTAAQFRPPGCIQGFAVSAESADWRFQAVERAMWASTTGSNEDARAHLERLLTVGGSMGFKVWKLSPTLRIAKVAILTVLGAGTVALFVRNWNARIIPTALSAALTFANVAKSLVVMLVLALVATTVNALIGKKQGTNIVRIIRWRDAFTRLAVGVAMSTIGFLLARLHLYVFDRLYLRLGKLDKFPK